MALEFTSKLYSTYFISFMLAIYFPPNLTLEHDIVPLFGLFIGL